MEEKLKTAAAQRDGNIKKMLDRLKEHVSIVFYFFHNHLDRLIRSTSFNRKVLTFSVNRFQEDQVTRVRQGTSERVQQLESQIQGKLDQARERREMMEREQKEKLRNHVSFIDKH